MDSRITYCRLRLFSRDFAELYTVFRQWNTAYRRLRALNTCFCSVREFHPYFHHRVQALFGLSVFIPRFRDGCTETTRTYSNMRTCFPLLKTTALYVSRSERDCSATKELIAFSFTATMRIAAMLKSPTRGRPQETAVTIFPRYGRNVRLRPWICAKTAALLTAFADGRSVLNSYLRQTQRGKAYSLHI